ncbi:MAG: eCIS core domain-containing protein [Aquihabitans sp.]
MGLGRIERRPGYRLWIGGPVPPGAAAWTLGSLVIVRTRHAASEHLIAHELEHVRQYHDLGFAGFLARYLLAYASWRLRGYPHQAAYRRIPAEVSAEWHARRLLHIGAD